MSIFCWLATAVCLAGTAVNIRRANLCFYLWIVGEAMWSAYDLRLGLYSRSVLDMVGLALAILGAWVNDLKPRMRNLKSKTK